jgi:hypothetical protein
VTPRTERAIEALASRLARSHDELEACFELPQERLTRRPAEDSWSPAEVLEHVSLTSHYLLVLVQKIAEKVRRRQARGLTPPQSPPHFEHLDVFASSEYVWDSPEHMQPTGRAAPREVRTRLRVQGRAIAELLQEFQAGEGSLYDLRLSMLDPDGPHGDRLDLYQYLYFLGLHAERHLAQIGRALG